MWRQRNSASFVDYDNRQRPHHFLPHRATLATLFDNMPKALTGNSRDSDSHTRIRHDRIRNLRRDAPSPRHASPHRHRTNPPPEPTSSGSLTTSTEAMNRVAMLSWHMTKALTVRL